MLSECDWIWNSRQGKAPLAPSIEAQQMLGIRIVYYVKCEHYEVCGKTEFKL